MVLNFTHDGVVGTIDVCCERNDDPAALGCRSGSLGLPACTATVASDARGYRAMFGWVQLVRSSDNRSAGDAFEMDPFSLFADADSPYCFYGHLPTLFDGPGRPRRDDMGWLAHSFLATTPLRGNRRQVVPLAGFSWGFDIRDGSVIVHAPAPLTSAHWREHLSVLGDAYPGWQFTSDDWAA